MGGFAALLRRRPVECSLARVLIAFLHLGVPPALDLALLCRALGLAVQPLISALLLGEMTAPELGEMTATRDASVAELEEEDEEEEAPTSEGASTSEIATAFCAKA